MSLLIAGRLVYLRQSIAGHFGSESGKVYTLIAAMVVESGAFYSVFGLTCIIDFAVRRPIQDISYYALLQAAVRLSSLERVSLLSMHMHLFTSQCISTDLIVLRVALGRAMTREIASLSLERHDSREHSICPDNLRNSRTRTRSRTRSQIRFSANELGQSRSGMRSINEREELEKGQVSQAPIVTMNVRDEELSRNSVSLSTNRSGDNSPL
jgi:hypothetical protein